MGDFNGYLDPRMDIHPPAQPPLGSKGNILSLLLQEVGWIDVWRTKYPTTKQFSCFSKTHGSLSRIGLCVGSPQLLAMVTRVEYFPRGVSDHSPLLAHLASRPGGFPPQGTMEVKCLLAKAFHITRTGGDTDRTIHF